jgi:hypothetical protein
MHLSGVKFDPENASSIFLRDAGIQVWRLSPYSVQDFALSQPRTLPYDLVQFVTVLIAH